MDFDTAVKLNIYETIARTTQAPCTVYLGYPFQYVCADDELRPYFSLFIHITGKLFHD
jgi:hypothetical protein